MKTQTTVECDHTARTYNSQVIYWTGEGFYRIVKFVRTGNTAYMPTGPDSMNWADGIDTVYVQETDLTA